jgi:hypothetical protein
MGLSFTFAAGPRQRSQPQARIPRNSLPYFTVSDSRLPHPGGPDPHIYIPQEQGNPVIPRVHTIYTENTVSIVIVQQYLDCCMRTRCRGNPFTKQLPSDSPGIVDGFTGHYQATHFPSRYRCIATAIQATILCSLTALGAFRLNTKFLINS